MANDLDPRRHAWRDDLADIRLKGRVKATEFVVGERMRVICPVADLKAKPHAQAGLMSQLLLGEDVLVFEKTQDYCFIQSVADNYVGYVQTSDLRGDITPLTYYVLAPRSFIYPKPDMKLPPICAVSIGSKLEIVDFVEVGSTLYGVMPYGCALFAGHLAQLPAPFPKSETQNGDKKRGQTQELEQFLKTASHFSDKNYGKNKKLEHPADCPSEGKMPLDYVSIAENLIHTPYLWGGRSAFGIDCSGLVQLSLQVAGYCVPRDSDMQCQEVGKLLDKEETLRRGDLVFWRGHVAIMQDSTTLIHANGASMDVSCESYTSALTRIADHHGPPIAHRRPLL